MREDKKLSNKFVKVNMQYLQCVNTLWPSDAIWYLDQIGSGNDMALTQVPRQAFNQLPLTHWGQDKMATIFRTTFSNAFLWMKIYKFWLRFHWNLLPRVQLTNSSIGSDNGLALVRRQVFIWTNDGLLCWRIYASLSLNEYTDPAWLSPTNERKFVD